MKYTEMFKRVGVSPFSPLAYTKSGTLMTKNGFPLKSLLLPNVDEFRILGKTMDELAYAMYGIEKAKYRRIKTKKMLSNPCNDYLTRCYERLYKYSRLGDDKKFERLANAMISRSTSLKLLALTRVDSKWYKETKWKALVKTWEKLCQLCRSKNNYHLKVKRVLIPKANTLEMRPLGVPAPSYRMYMFMIQLMVNIWLWDRRPEWQHGFRPWHGTGTAWNQIYKDVLPAKYIWEFDLKKFFDSVNHRSLEVAMIRNQIPTSLRDWIMKATKYVAETKDKEQRKSWSSIMGNAANWLGNKKQSISRIWKAYLISPIYGKLVEQNHGSTLELNRGVPQGCNISPITAVLTFETQMRGMHKFDASLVMYADDGLIYGDDETEVKLASMFLAAVARSIGTEVHEKKSKWIKENGVWNSDLKFLGLRYEPSSGLLHGATRNGSTQAFPIKEALEDSLLKHGYDTSIAKEYERDKMKFWVKHKHLGMLMAYLYNKGKLRFEDKMDMHVLTVADNSFLALHEQELIRRMEKWVETDIKNMSTHALRMFMNRLRRYNGHLVNRIVNIKPMRAKTHKRLKGVPKTKSV